MNMHLTDIAGLLHYVAYGGDLAVVNQTMRLEPDEAGDGFPQHRVLELIATTPADAALLAARHKLAAEHELAACLSPGTQMWSGWINRPTAQRPGSGMRCVVYAPTTQDVVS